MKYWRESAVDPNRLFNATKMEEVALDRREHKHQRTSLSRVLSASALFERRRKTLKDDLLERINGKQGQFFRSRIQQRLLKRVGMVGSIDNDDDLELLLGLASASSEVTRETQDEAGCIVLHDNFSNLYNHSRLQGIIQSTGKSLSKKKVSFHQVIIHEHRLILGDHPDVSAGAPTCLDWECQRKSELTVDAFEAKSKEKRSARDLLLSPHLRSRMLHRAGYSFYEIGRATIEVEDYHKERLEFLKRLHSVSACFGRAVAFAATRDKRRLPRFHNLSEQKKRGLSQKRQVEMPKPSKYGEVVTVSSSLSL